jgi:hypothetical protein
MTKWVRGKGEAMEIKLNPKSTSWLIKDRQWKWKFGKWQCRIEQWHSYYMLTPLIGFDWQEGMFSLRFGWIRWCVGIDYEFDPEYDPKQHEADYPE